ncbi:MAG: hypothetical protein V4634_10135 [Pseudomonadota bacterium]
MKASNKLQSSFQAKLFLGALLAVVTLGIALTARNPAPTPAIMVDDTVHTVVISAKRLSAEEKQAMAAQDANDKVQTVILTAKRLSASEKQASLREEQQTRHHAARLLTQNSADRVKEATQFS